MCRQEAPEDAAMVSDLEMEEFVHDDIVLEGQGLIEQIRSEGAPAARGAGGPFPRHLLHPNLRWRDSDAVRPVEHSVSELIHGLVRRHVRRAMIRSPMSTMRLPVTSLRSDL
jgi:hypothetical protein